MIRLMLALIFLTINTLPAQAQNFDLQHFQNMPIQHEGRLKSLDSFATISLQTLSGHKTLKDMSATDWLTTTLFDPLRAAEIEVIAIPEKALKKKLGLPDGKDLFSYAALKPGLDNSVAEVLSILEKEPETHTPFEKSLVNIHEKAAFLLSLMRSMNPVLPLSISTENIDGHATFRTALQIERTLKSDVAALIARKGENPQNYTQEELALVQTAMGLEQMRLSGKNNHLFRVIPPIWEPASNEWLSLWDVILSGKGGPQSDAILSQWEALAQSYQSNAPSQWKTVSKALLNQTLTMSNGLANPSQFKAERLYRSVKPYAWILGFYLCSLIGFLCSIKRHKFLYGGYIFALGGVVAHIAALGARIYILERPPVGTLYETLLFVSLIAVVAGVLMGRIRKDTLPSTAGLFAGLSLLSIAPLFQNGADSLEVLVAVLNTNFWLTTHVLIITSGYAVCILCAVLAHGVLTLKTLKPANAYILTLQNSVYALSILALFLTAFGTVLGGIWADQSWGRFWGWDPKENGALLIVLWLIWVQHGRAASKLSPLAFQALIAALSIIVALSWFGVNLLGVGLHSYGFTDGVAEGLIAFCILETLLIAGLYSAARLKGART